MRYALALVTLPALWGEVEAGDRYRVVGPLPSRYTVVVTPTTPTLPTDPSQPAPAGYQWQKVGDGPWKLVKLAPEVAPARPTTFQSGLQFDPDHSCPQCGRSQFVIDRFLPSGEHVHTCAVGHSWYH